MRNSGIYLLSLAAAGLTASCGYTAPYQSTGPALSKEGVQITLAGEQCYVNRSTEVFPTAVDDNVLHVGLSLQVANHSDEPAVVSLDGFQLAESVGSEHAVMHPIQSGSVTLPPGQSTDLMLEFSQTQESALDCHHDLALDTRSAVAIEGKPVRLAGIHFVPAH
jgi:hypothetical protein